MGKASRQHRSLWRGRHRMAEFILHGNSVAALRTGLRTRESDRLLQQSVFRCLSVNGQWPERGLWGPPACSFPHQVVLVERDSRLCVLGSLLNKTRMHLHSLQCLCGIPTTLKSVPRILTSAKAIVYVSVLCYGGKHVRYL